MRSEITPKIRRSMLLSNAVKFQKALALATGASNPHEAAAAETAARRLMTVHNINPAIIPDTSLYNRMNFGSNPLLQKLRAEWHAAHPDYKVDRYGRTVRVRSKPVAKPVNTNKSKPAAASPHPVQHRGIPQARSQACRQGQSQGQAC